MAQWRKVVVSGSSPEFNGVTLSGDLTVAGGDIVLGSTSIFSGGNTAQLNNIDALDATTEATIESAIDTLSNLTAASSLVTVSTLNSGAISSGFGAIDIGTSTLNAGNTTVDTFANDSAVASSHITGSMSGSFTGTFSGDGSSLTGVAQDIDSLSALGGASLHQTQDYFHFSDNGTEKKITFSNLEDSIFANVSGDIAIAAGGAATIQANSVALATDTTGDYVQNITAGAGLASSGATSGENIAHTLTVDISEFSDVQIASGDKVLVLDSDGSTEQLESIDDIATLMAGDGLAASSAVLAVQVDDTTIETNSDSLRAKTAAIADGGSGLATADQIHTFYTAGGSNLATALNTDLGGDFTIGNQSSDTATFSGAVTITGNLDVNGTLTTIDSTNLRVADRFIYASSGSTSGDGGLIVGTGADGVGTAIGYDDSASRWALTKADDTAENATSITPRQYVVSVSGSGADASSNPSDFGSSGTDRIGMMHVNTSTGDIFIFS
jgi:hypothetical protein